MQLAGVQRHTQFQPFDIPALAVRRPAHIADVADRHYGRVVRRVGEIKIKVLGIDITVELFVKGPERDVTAAVEIGFIS